MAVTKPLSLVELLNLANKSYPDGYLAEYFNPENGGRRRGSGDTLAEFIVIELRETLDLNASRSEQLEEARRVMNRAVNHLEGVIQSLQ